MSTELRPTPECDANAFVARKMVNGEYHGLHDAIPLALGKKLERERDSAKTLNRSLLDQLEAKDAQIEAMRKAIKEAYESLNVSTTFGTTPRQDQVRAKLKPFIKP